MQSFHYIVLIVKGGGCCYNFGKLISSCTRCHNIQLKYYFPALPWPRCGGQPASEKALGWKAKLSAAHSVNGAAMYVLLCTDLEVKPKLRRSDAGSTWEQLGQMNNSIGCHEEQIKQVSRAQAAPVTDTLIRKSKAD